VEILGISIREMAGKIYIQVRNKENLLEEIEALPLTSSLNVVGIIANWYYKIKS